MKQHMFKILPIIALVMFVEYCTEPIGEVIPITISGKVLDQSNNSPISDAIVRLFSPDSEKIEQTDVAGDFLFTLGVDSSMDLSIIVNKEGFLADTITALAVPDRDISLSTIYLRTPTDGDGGGGDTTTTPIPGTSGPSNIGLQAISAPIITVMGSGGSDNTTITFQVKDSTGASAGIGIDVDFNLGSSPNGGEYLSETVATTDKFGLVSVNLVSGTISGVVQVVASIDLGTSTITSQAVKVTIHGGLPDQAHFGISAGSVNFPGWNDWGLNNQIKAFVGDKYGNFCAPGTAVYFTTDGGLIGGSSVTKDGTCQVPLVSALPRPEHPTLGKGYATIIARTGNDQNETIADSVIVLFSGSPVISGLSPTTFALPDAGSQDFIFNVKDQNGNPLAKGTIIIVKVDGSDVVALGDVTVTLFDTQEIGSGITDFGFTLVETSALVEPRTVRVTISTSGPNGVARTVISGTAS